MQPFCTHFSTRNQESVPKVFSWAFLSHPKGWHLPAHSFCEYIVYGNWTNRWFGVKSPDDARKQLEKFKNTLKTVGDIYRRFIESDVRAREKDIEAYDKKVEREKALPDCIE